MSTDPRGTSRSLEGLGLLRAEDMRPSAEGRGQGHAVRKGRAGTCPRAPESKSVL